MPLISILEKMGKYQKVILIDNSAAKLFEGTAIELKEEHSEWHQCNVVYLEAGADTIGITIEL